MERKLKRFLHTAKKKNFLFEKAVFLLMGILFFLFASCKTTPVSNPVNPLDLLDGESAIYFAIPTKSDPEFVATILKNNVPSLSESDVKNVIDRINVVYAGLIHSRSEMSFQCAVSCNIPTVYHSKIFSKKNGWSTAQYIPAGSTTKFNLYENGDLTISLPDANTLCLGRDVTKMLDTYQILSMPIPVTNISDSAGQSIEAEDDVIDVNGGNPYMEDAFYDYLNTAENEIRFFAQKPQSFLSMLTGTNLDLKLAYVKGEIKNDPNRDAQCILDLDFQFKNERYVKPGKALLSLTFGLTDSDITISSKNLKIRGIKISKAQLYKLLTF